MYREALHNRRWFLAVSAKTVAAVQARAVASSASQLAVEVDLPSFGGATGWLNSEPLTRARLNGKVVLVDFWTYTCINWRRTLPYVRAWSKKYRDQGLVVIGVHTPEFAFEKKVENVRQAVTAMNIDYPIAIDSGYAIWRAFNNEYWPVLYFVDARGRIRAHKFGEGEYRDSELVIQNLLAKNGASGFEREAVSLDASGAEAAADWADLKSKETYVGYEQTENFASPGGMRRHKCHSYVFPTELRLNHWALAGNWTAGEHATVSAAADARIAFHFHARDLHLVMGAASQGSPVTFRIVIDGQPPGSASGVDSDEKGRGTVSQPRMYQLIRQQRPILDRRFEIQFFGSSVEVFSFTFG